jgi:hypothetical protein
LITGCIVEDKKDDNPINSVGKEVDDRLLGLNSFCNGGFDQTETLRVLIYNGDVYGIDADKAFLRPYNRQERKKLTSLLLLIPFHILAILNFSSLEQQQVIPSMDC